MRECASILRGLVVVVIVLYPIAVYLGIKTLPPSLFGFLLVALLAARFGVIKGEERVVVLPILLVLMAYAVLAVVVRSERFLLLYPVLVNASLFLVFMWSLRTGDPILLRIVRARGIQISRHGPSYLRHLTAVWAGFFLANGAVAAWTISQSLEVWALYNGFIAYVFVACLVGVEWLFRLYYKRLKGTA